MIHQQKDITRGRRQPKRLRAESPAQSQHPAKFSVRKSYKSGDFSNQT